MKPAVPAILHLMLIASCTSFDHLESASAAALATTPTETCFNNLDDDHDAKVDEGCDSFEVPAAVTAYAGGETEARLFLNVGKAVVIDGVGVVHETWLKVTHVIDPVNIAAIRGMVMYRRSLDNGAHFTTEQALTIDSDFTGYPKIAAFGDNVYITFHAIYGPAGTPPQPSLIRSANNGQGVFAIQKLSTTPAAMPTIAAFGPFVHVVWAAGSPSFAEIFIVSSSDSGAHFSAPLQISSSDNRSSWTPAVATWGTRVLVAWTDERNDTVDCQGSSDPGTQCREELYAAVSSDAGQHFRCAACGPETQISWKLHALAEMGASFRPKDIADLWLVTSHVPLEATALPPAITAAFESRGYTLDQARDVLHAPHWSTKTARVRWSTQRPQGPELAGILDEVRARLAPVMASLR